MTSSGPCGPGRPCSPWKNGIKGVKTYTKQQMHSCQRPNRFLTSSPLAPASDPPGSPYTTAKSLVRFYVCVDVRKDFLLQHALAKIVKQETHW